MTEDPDDAFEQHVARVREVCTALPEVREEAAWTGTRWTVRAKNFAHVVAIADGWPPAYAAAAGTDGPACVLTFRVPLDEVDAYRALGAPWFVPPWFPNLVGVVLDARTDRARLRDSIVDSYRTLAPRHLAAQVTDTPPDAEHR